MVRRHPTKRLASNAAATLAALALTFGYLIPQPCLCRGCEVRPGQKHCCCEASLSDCCQAQSCCTAASKPAADASLDCNGCTCEAAPEPTIAIPFVHSHGDDGAAPAALVGQLAAIVPDQPSDVVLTVADRTGAPPGMRLHAFYSVWLN